MTPSVMDSSPDPASPSTGWRAVDLLWLGLGLGLFAATAAVAYRPTIDGPGAVAEAVVPLVTIVGLAISLSGDRLRVSAQVTALALAVAIGGWSLLLAGDDRWSIVSVAVYGACYRAYEDAPRAAIASSAVATALWIAAWSTGDTPMWTVVVTPIGVFVAGAAIYSALRELGRLTREQAELIDDLRRTRGELAAAERAKGALEERAWMAGEIHDTLAQGFTSIVLLSRAAQRSRSENSDLAEIEATAAENLAAARRLIEAENPTELDIGSLTDALRDQVEALPDSIPGEFRVEGTPRRPERNVEAIMLRALQEMLLNVRTHSQARGVQVTLSFLGEVVALDVRDDGIGIEPGQISDRGVLTGGQGLELIRRRADALGGVLTLEDADGGGTVVSLQLPVHP